MKPLTTTLLILIILEAFTFNQSLQLYARIQATEAKIKEKDISLYGRSLPEAEAWNDIERHNQYSEIKPYEEITATITAYTLDISETDGNPFNSSCGSVLGVDFNIIACPRRLPCGTVVEIDGIEYVCWDVMALKNDGMFDILMKDKRSALKFGRQIKEVKIFYFNLITP